MQQYHRMKLQLLRVSSSSPLILPPLLHPVHLLPISILISHPHSFLPTNFFFLATSHSLLLTLSIPNLSLSVQGSKAYYTASQHVPPHHQRQCPEAGKINERKYVLSVIGHKRVVWFYSSMFAHCLSYDIL